MVTIDELRVDWQKQIEAYDDMIARLDKEKNTGVENEGLGAPRRVWTGMLHKWRDELVDLLAQYPGNHHKASA
jgi:hypothetical protein